MNPLKITIMDNDMKITKKDIKNSYLFSEIDIHNEKV